MAKKMKITPVLAALAGGVGSELLMKFVPFGGKFSPAIGMALGALLMQGKGDMMIFAGAGMVGNSGAALAGNFLPSIKVSDDTIDTVYEEIINDRRLNKGVGEQVLLGYDEDDEPVYGTEDELSYYPAASSVNEQVLMGVEQIVT